MGIWGDHGGIPDSSFGDGGMTGKYFSAASVFSSQLIAPIVFAGLLVMSAAAMAQPDVPSSTGSNRARLMMKCAKSTVMQAGLLDPHQMRGFSNLTLKQ